MQYQAEAFQMDSDDLVASLGSWRDQRAARHACEKHAQDELEFRSRQPGVWKAQGMTSWYKITRVEE